MLGAHAIDRGSRVFGELREAGRTMERPRNERVLVDVDFRHAGDLDDYGAGHNKFLSPAMAHHDGARVKLQLRNADERHIILRMQAAFLMQRSHSSVG